MPLSEVRAGQSGYGLSVFSGQEPERFGVEILGVWRNTEPDTSYILARLHGQGLEVSGVIAGMSGSPVYVDERLVGAVAFAWPFSIEPIAGITPIENMRRLASGAPSRSIMTAADPSVTLQHLVSLDLPSDLFERQLAMLRPDPMAGTTDGVVWGAAGFGQASLSPLEQALGTTTLAGTSEMRGGSQISLQPGSAVSGVLVDGDFRIAATGTVTERQGDRILAFGHPFLGLGSIRIPMAAAEIVTVLSNQLNSFKIANLGPVVGALDLDRSAGVRGGLGLDAPVTPVTISVRGEEEKSYRLRVARVPIVTPGLLAASLLGALDATTQAQGNQGLDLRARFDLGSNGSLEIEQSFDSEGAGMEAALYLLAFSGYLLNNELETVEIEGLEVELDQFPLARTARLVEAHASKTLVRPGESISLALDLIAYRGDRVRRSLQVAIPTGIPDGRYSLLVGDGVTLDVARLTVEQREPVSFPQALAFLQSLHSRRDLVVLGLFGGRGLAVAGEVLPQLPGSVRSLWGAAASTSAIPLEVAIAQQQEERLDLPIEGAARVDLEVRRRGPLSLSEDDGADPQSIGGESEGSAAGPGGPPVEADNEPNQELF